MSWDKDGDPAGLSSRLGGGGRCGVDLDPPAALHDSAFFPRRPLSLRQDHDVVLCRPGNEVELFAESSARFGVNTVDIPKSDLDLFCNCGLEGGQTHRN